MTAAANRSAAPDGARAAAQDGAQASRVGAGDAALLDALPIGAGIFTLNGGRLWIDGLNRKFLELAGCEGSPEAFAETFKRYAAGPGGNFAAAYLRDTAEAPDEIDLVEGEGVARRYLKLKLSPLSALPNGGPRCL